MPVILKLAVLSVQNFDSTPAMDVAATVEGPRPFCHEADPDGCHPLMLAEAQSCGKACPLGQTRPCSPPRDPHSFRSDIRFTVQGLACHDFSCIVHCYNDRSCFCACHILSFELIGSMYESATVLVLACRPPWA